MPQGSMSPSSTVLKAQSDVHSFLSTQWPHTGVAHEHVQRRLPRPDTKGPDHGIDIVERTFPFRAAMEQSYA